MPQRTLQVSVPTIASRQLTVKLKVSVCVVGPPVAVTVTLYVPAGVPVDPPPLELLPLLLELDEPPPLLLELVDPLPLLLELVDPPLLLLEPDGEAPPPELDPPQPARPIAVKSSSTTSAT